MGRFSGYLIACDYDNTITDTQSTLDLRSYIAPEDAAAIRSFMEQGGVFAVATGRSLPDARGPVTAVPTNAPAIIFNGACIYDFSTEACLHAAYLTDSAPRIRDYMAQVLAAFPQLGAEFYHDDNTIHACRVNKYILSHRRISDTPMTTVERPFDVPDPISKVLLEGEPALLRQAEAYILAQSWAAECELIFSFDTLLEVTARGGNKADAVARLAAMLGIDPGRVCCVGDHLNDIPMLKSAAFAFAPVTARAEVRALPGIQLIAAPGQGAMADLVEKLAACIEPCSKNGQQA